MEVNMATFALLFLGLFLSTYSVAGTKNVEDNAVRSVRAEHEDRSSNVTTAGGTENSKGNIEPRSFTNDNKNDSDSPAQSLITEAENDKNIPDSASEAKTRSRRAARSRRERAQRKGKRSRSSRRESLEKLRRQVIRARDRASRVHTIKSKGEEQFGSQLVANDDDDDGNATDYDYDYDDDADDDDDDDDDSIYSFVEFEWQIYDSLAELNDTLLEELRMVKEKVALLENLLIDNVGRTQKLEALLSQGSNPSVGDLRLKVSGVGEQSMKEGYLQFYTGTCWGFVCDDFFNPTAAKIACIQLGYTGDNASMSSPPISSSALDETWKNGFEIVLDDVHCSEREDTLKACEHSEFGEHDCSLEEIVYLSC